MLMNEPLKLSKLRSPHHIISSKVAQERPHQSQEGAVGKAPVAIIGQSQSTQTKNQGRTLGRCESAPRHVATVYLEALLLPLPLPFGLPTIV